MRDPYAVLGLEPRASNDEIRAAYRARSMLLHPDLHEGRPAAVRSEAQRAMAQLTEAYESLIGSATGGAGQADSLAFRLGRVVGRLSRRPRGA